MREPSHLARSADVLELVKALRRARAPLTGVALLLIGVPVVLALPTGSRTSPDDITYETLATTPLVLDSDTPRTTSGENTAPETSLPTTTVPATTTAPPATTTSTTGESGDSAQDGTQSSSVPDTGGDNEADSGAPVADELSLNDPTSWVRLAPEATAGIEMSAETDTDTRLVVTYVAGDSQTGNLRQYLRDALEEIGWQVLSESADGVVLAFDSLIGVLSFDDETAFLDIESV